MSVRQSLRVLFIGFGLSGLATCNSGGGGGGGTPPGTAPTLALATDVQTLNLTWTAVSDATYYKLYENPDGVSGYSQIGGDLAGTSYSQAIAVHLYNWAQARYFVEACNSGGCGPDSSVVNAASAVLAAIGYFKASNTEAGDRFGSSLAVSADGNTLAVGAPIEASSATNIGGDQADNSASNSGAVYVFIRAGAAWSQQAYVKASNTQENDLFGGSVALSSDGNTLAVGATEEASNATGIDGNQTDNSATVRARSGLHPKQRHWSSRPTSRPRTRRPDLFGYSLALSGDGTTLAVGAFGEDSSATGIDGNQTDNSAGSAGAVYVFTRAGATWLQQAYVKASNTEAADQFGIAVALSGDGNTLAVGANWEDSIARGVAGNQADNTFGQSGSVYVFARSGATWSQQAYVKASNTGIGDEFGLALALSGDGTRLGDTWKTVPPASAAANRRPAGGGRGLVFAEAAPPVPAGLRQGLEHGGNRPFRPLARALGRWHHARSGGIPGRQHRHRHRGQPSRQLGVLRRRGVFLLI
jgi:hypothetical protein